MTSGTRIIFIPKQRSGCCHTTMNRTTSAPNDSAAMMFKSVFMIWSVMSSILRSAGMRETVWLPACGDLRPPRQDYPADCVKSPVE